jgi:hypothetical protein
MSQLSCAGAVDTEKGNLKEHIQVSAQNMRSSCPGWTPKEEWLLSEKAG